ncbi:HAMP domain-containing sensor histidine kinase [Lacticaseibacillus hulanensis]|uniref:HAMP domain-containing sensor histidine kinase n=1 Tax=Lacticaseibacillus hulanensis TaxID=2493111 RepID=UPI000FD9B713|nr:HAMP domain-containing histidine kinase [Lacticaseibacillus hulanensis]
MADSQEEVAQPKPKRFISLRWKWAATVGVGIFLTFIVFSLVIYGVMRQTLAERERTTVVDTVNAVESRLTPVADNLTPSSVRPRLDASLGNTITQENAPAESGKDSIFADSMIEKISREDITVTVFNRSGEVVFNSRGNHQPLHRTTPMTIKNERRGKFDGMVGRVAVISDHTGRRIGYIQVANAMTDFHATMNRITRTIYIVALVAFVISFAVGFWLASRFLKPIKRITTTIDLVNSEPQSDVRIEQINANDEMSHLINEFNAMLDRIQRFMDQQSDFVGDVSHELRTPVAVLEGHLKLLSRWGKDDPEVLDESLAASLQETARMKSLIQEMLDLTRADQVDLMYADSVVEVQQLAHQVVSDMSMIHPDFNITLEDEFDGPSWVQMYRNHLEQVLIILVDNAVKYSKDRKEIHVSIGNSDAEVNIAVQDFGEGISPENMHRVFGRFYRVDKARSREKGGNGLGLAIAKQLIDGYHGEISVDSSLGYGSVFRINLPRITAERAEELAASHGDGDAEALIADDIKNSNL